MNYVQCNVNDDIFRIISDYEDAIIIDYYGIKLLVKIDNHTWKRIRLNRG